MLEKLIASIRSQNKLSIRIELQTDTDFFSEGLLELICLMGVNSSELNFDLFENQNPQYVLRILHGQQTRMFEEGHIFTIQYDTLQQLDNVIRREIQMYSSHESSPRELVKYESISDLWSQIGTGIKNEAHPTQHLDLVIHLNCIRNQAIFKALAYFVLRQGLYATTVELPLFEKKAANLVLQINEISTNATFELVSKNHFLLSAQADILPTLLNKISKEKHYCDGGQFGWWERPDFEKSEIPSDVYEWEEKSEAKRILDQLQIFEADSPITLYITAPLEIRKQFQAYVNQQFQHLTIKNVRSAFKPGYYWLMEEVLPQLSKENVECITIRCRNGSSSNHLELDNRWLMEIYPADELIAKELNIDEQHIQFEIVKDLNSIYEVLVNGELLDSFSPLYHSFDYIDGNNKVAPTTAGIQTSKQDIIIPSDRELFYRTFTEQIMPRILKKCKYFEGAGVVQPLFNRIHIHYTSFGIEEPLPIKEDLNSSFEALYEDLYFNTLHLCKLYGENSVNVSFTAPGGVIPYIKIGADILQNTYAKIELFEWNECQVDRRVAQTLIFNDHGEYEEVIVKNEGNFLKLKFQHELILDHEIPTLHPSIQEYIADFSYNGHPIRYLELTAPITGDYYSGLKKSNMKHTILIEAGHHPNEVSSTPAIDMLVNYIIQNEIELLNDVNIILIPVANIDSKLLLEELVKEHPKWKHHAARFNAVGLEFAHVKFQETLFGEANVVPLLLKKWAPDVVIDNHGIPAHEWVQPFTGYTTPPLFPISYNLPIAKMYGIGRYIDSEWKSIHYKNSKLIAESVNLAFNDHPVAIENTYRREKYMKYGHQWVPEKYPIENAGNLNFYLESSVTPEYPTVSIFRYPSWISVDVISEAADEVVYGGELESCIEAQFKFNLAIIRRTARVKLMSNKNTGLKVRPIEFEVLK